MKYIVIQVQMKNSKIELPFIFHDNMIHSDVADHMVKLCSKMFGGAVRPVSAGSLSSLDINSECSGRSSTLAMHTRGKIDDDLIRMMDYGSMHVD